MSRSWFIRYRGSCSLSLGLAVGTFWVLELSHFYFIFVCLSRHTTTSSVGVFFFNSISHTKFSASNISFPSFDCHSLPTSALPAADPHSLAAFPRGSCTPPWSFPLLLPLSCSPVRVPPAAVPLCISSWLPTTEEAGERQEVLLKKGKVTLHAPCQKCFSYPVAA